MTLKENVLKAARATHIPEGRSGRWTVQRFRTLGPLLVPREEGKVAVLPAGEYTQLYCMTDATMHQIGELVMDDTERELKKHLSFMLAAHGRVLITGLGLGCVVRGCLANPAVKHVVCIERSMDVMNLVGTQMPRDDKRLTIILADALEWVPRHSRPGEFDCAWHDLWTDTCQGEPHLALWHSKLLVHCIESKVKVVGAWSFPRYIRRSYREKVGVTVL